MRAYDPIAASEPPVALPQQLDEINDADLSREPKGIAELLSRAALMLEEIQEEFMGTAREKDPKAARAALAAATPLIKLLADKAPQMSADRYRLAEEALVAALEQADEEYRERFCELYHKQLEQRSVAPVGGAT